MKRFKSAITGEFVTKKFAKENPDTTVEITIDNLKEELEKFRLWAVANGKYLGSADVVEEYLKSKK